MRLMEIEGTGGAVTGEGAAPPMNDNVTGFDAHAGRGRVTFMSHVSWMDEAMNE